MTREEDRLFADNVLRAGLAGDVEIKHCMRLLKRRGPSGRRRLLPEVMADRGVLTPDQVEENLAQIHRSVAFCSGCGTSQYAPQDPSVIVRCARCGHPLERRSSLGHMPAGPWLALLKEGKVEATFPLTGKTFTIGRGPESKIVLDDPRASRQHARVMTRENGSGVKEPFGRRADGDTAQLGHRDETVIVEDLGSHNGTLVNGRRIENHALKPGDLVRVGRSLFVYLVPGMPVTRDKSDTVGTLSGDVPGMGMVRVPVTPAAVLIGRAPQADIRITEEDAPDFAAQIVAVSDGAELADLRGAAPGRKALIAGAAVHIGSLRLVYTTAGKEKAAKRKKVPQEAKTPDKAAAGTAVAHPHLSAMTGKSDVRQTTVGISDEKAVLEAMTAEAERLESGVAGQSDSAEKEAQSPQAARVVTLTLTAGPCPKQDFVVTDEPAVIGRHETCDIFLSDPRISRRHARIARSEGEPFIEDLQSVNGVFVNGRPVRRQPLKPGDVIRIGDSLFVVHL